VPITFQALFAPSSLALKFAIKTLLGGGLALWLAMRWGLEQPAWALMTAFIVAQPLSGMVLQKGLARWPARWSVPSCRWCSSARSPRRPGCSCWRWRCGWPVYRRFDPAAQRLGLCLRAGRLHRGDHCFAGDRPPAAGVRPGGGALYRNLPGHCLRHRQQCAALADAGRAALAGQARQAWRNGLQAASAMLGGEDEARKGCWKASGASWR
jgi:hypothetical protein